MSRIEEIKQLAELKKNLTWAVWNNDDIAYLLDALATAEQERQALYEELEALYLRMVYEHGTDGLVRERLTERYPHLEAQRKGA